MKNVFNFLNFNSKIKFFSQNRSLLATKEQSLADLNPYFIPLISQYNDVKELCKPKDRFHTYRTRSCANIRDRIKIESPAYEDELIGTKKAMPKVATDIDEYYQAEIYHERSRTKYRFQPKTEIIKLRELIRKKMDVYWMKEKMVLDQVNAIKQEHAMEQIKSQIKEYDEFLDAYKDKNYNHSVKMIHEVKNYYQETDRLRKTFEVLKTQIEPLNMSIFLLGNEFIRLTILKKFQYLVKPTEWRLEHDYMHRTETGELENTRDCIVYRDISNLWNRDNATVHTIKNFIENVYLKIEHEKICLFENGEAFLKAAVHKLRAKSFRFLLQFHLIAHKASDTAKQFTIVDEKNRLLLNHWTSLAKILSEKRVFMEGRRKAMEQSVMNIIAKPLEQSFSAEKLHNLRGLCKVLFKKIVLKTGDSSVGYSPVEEIAEVEEKVFKILKQLDQIPFERIRAIEEEIRMERKKKLIQAERAHKIELTLQHRITQLRRCLEKPPKKEKREGKLPISVLPKKPPKIPIKKPLLTPIEEDYVRAFTELGADGEIKFDKNAKIMIDRIRNESIPFYLDHLLDTLGFKVPKETPEDAERILFDEAKNFKYKDVLPNVRDKVKLWEKQSEAVKQENIRKTPYLYE